METVNSLQLEKGRGNMMVPRRNMPVESVLLMDAPTMLRKEESAIDMEQSKNAATKDVPTMLSREGFVSNMGQRPRLAVMKDVPI